MLTPPTHRATRWPVFECLAMVGIGVLLNLVAFPGNPGFVRVHPHPAHVVVLIIGLRYGFRASLMAVAMCTLAYGFLLLQLAEVPTYLYLLDPPYSTPIVVLIPLGIIVGLLSQRHIDQVLEMREINRALQFESAHLRGEREQLRDVNLELAGRVVGAEGTVGQLYEFAKQLNVVSEDKIYDGLLQLLAESMGAERSTIWRVAGSQLEFQVSSDNTSAHAAVPPAYTHYEHLFDDRGVLALHDLPEQERNANMPFLLGKLKNNHTGQVVALVAVDALPFERYNDESIRLFRMIIEWASTSLGNVNAMRPAGAAPAGQLGPNPSNFVIQPTSVYLGEGPATQVAGEIPAPTTQPYDRPFAMPESTIEIRAHQLSRAGEAVVTPVEGLVSPPVRRASFLQPDQAVTILDGAREITSAIPQRNLGLRPQGFIPSRSMILLAEAGAPNPGSIYSQVTVAALPTDDVVDDGDKTIATSPLPERGDPSNS